MCAMNELNKHIHEILPKNKNIAATKPDMMHAIENISKSFVENDVDDFLRCFNSYIKIARLIMAPKNRIHILEIHSFGSIMTSCAEEDVIF